MRGDTALWGEPSPIQSTIADFAYNSIQDLLI